jgi:hypothetical protein
MTILCKTFCPDDLKQETKMLKHRGIGSEDKREKENNTGEEDAEEAEEKDQEA